MSLPDINLCPSDTSGDIPPCVINVLDFLAYTFEASSVAQEHICPLTGSAQEGLVTILMACAATLRRIGD